MKKLLLLLINLTGLPFFAEKLLLKKKLTIIYYHNIKPDIFSQHIKYLKKNYNIIPLIDLINNNISLPDYPLIITIDDGNAQNYMLLSVIKEFYIASVEIVLLKI